MVAQNCRDVKPIGSGPVAWDARDTRYVAGRLLVLALSAVVTGITGTVLPQIEDHDWLIYLAYALFASFLEAGQRYLRNNKHYPAI